MTDRPLGESAKIRLRGGPAHGQDRPDNGQGIVAWDDTPPVLLGVPDTPEYPARVRRGRYSWDGEFDADGNRLFRWQGFEE